MYKSIRFSGIVVAIFMYVYLLADAEIIPGYKMTNFPTMLFHLIVNDPSNFCTYSCACSWYKLVGFAYIFSFSVRDIHNVHKYKHKKFLVANKMYYTTEIKRNRIWSH